MLTLTERTERNCFSQVSRSATGILGETFVPTLDAEGHHIMSGMASIRGSQEDCEWLGIGAVYGDCRRYVGRPCDLFGTGTYTAYFGP